MKSFRQYLNEVIDTKRDVSGIRMTKSSHDKLHIGSGPVRKVKNHRTRYDFPHPDGKRHVTLDYVGTSEDGEHHPKQQHMTWTLHNSKRAINNKTNRASSTEHTKVKTKKEDVPTSSKDLAEILGTIGALHNRHLSNLNPKTKKVWAKSKGKRTKINTRMSDSGELEHPDFHHDVHHPEHPRDHSYFEWNRK